MRGRSTCPTEQKKHSVGATAGSPLFLLLQGKVGYRIAPSSDPASPAHLPPEGKALGVGEPLPVCETTSPSPPSRWAGRYGRKIQGRRPGRKKEDPPQGPLNQSRESRGEKLSPLALFPPVSREKRGPPPGAGRATGRCAPRLRKSPDHPKGTQHRPPPQKEGYPEGYPHFLFHR